MSKKNDIKVSVIIPCYNEEFYISRCLDTVINQTLKEIEVIIVDDGSVDNTPIICDRYYNVYPNKIKVIHQTNQGQGMARNAGIEIAKGRYIGFVDADDWIDSTMFEKMYADAIQYDTEITFCDIKKIDVEKNKEIYEKSMNYSSGLIDIGLYLCKGLNNAYSMNRIYKRELWDRYRYKKMIYEDLELLLVMQSNCIRMSYVPEFLCTYYKHKGSTTTSFKNIQLLDMIHSYRNAVYNCNHKYRNEVSYNVASRLLRYLDTPGLQYYKSDFIDEIHELYPFFENNPLIIQDNNIQKILKFKEVQTLPNNIYIGNINTGRNMDFYQCNIFTRNANIYQLNDLPIQMELAPNCIQKALQNNNYDFINTYYTLLYLHLNGGLGICGDFKLCQPIGYMRTLGDFIVINKDSSINVFGFEKASNNISVILSLMNDFDTKKNMQDLFNSFLYNPQLINVKYIRTEEIE